MIMESWDEVVTERQGKKSFSYLICDLITMTTNEMARASSLNLRSSSTARFVAVLEDMFRVRTILTLVWKVAAECDRNYLCTAEQSTFLKFG